MIYYLGPQGSYSYVLAKQVFGDANLEACDSFQKIIGSLADDSAVGVLPIENSITSNVHENIDHIFNNSVEISGEAFLKINLHLIGMAHAKVTDVTTVFSHPKALAQSSNFLKQHGINAEGVASTAVGRKHVLKRGEKESAFIGNASLAEDDDLTVLQEHVGNNDHNLTRFVFVRKAHQHLFGAFSSPDELDRGWDKLTSIIRLKHEAGSLVRFLNVLANQRINLTKIESRPIPGTDWEYDFWIDMDCSEVERREIEGLLNEHTLEYRIVGLYNKGKIYES